MELRRAECCYNCDHSTCVRWSSWSICALKKNDDNTVYWHQVCEHFVLRQEENPPTT